MDSLTASSLATELRPVVAADLAAVHELLDTRSRALHGSSEVSLGQVRDRMVLPGYDGWVATSCGRAVGYASLDAAREIELAVDDPQLADALLARVEECARRRGFDALTLTTAGEDGVVVRHAGFAHDRTILRMWRPLDDLPEPRLPTGVSVRAYEPADAAAVKALLDAAYAGWDRSYAARPHDDWVAFMTGHADFDPALWLLAERADRLVGCALHWREHQRRGWLKDLVVVDGERGRGLGTALVHQGLRAYAGRHVERVGLKVDTSNPTGAPRLYERLGFVADRRYELWAKRL